MTTDLQPAPAQDRGWCKPGLEHLQPGSCPSARPQACPAIYDVLSISVLVEERRGDGWSLGVPIHQSLYCNL